MKQIILCIMLVTLSAASFSQQTPIVKVPLTKADYLQKSKSQKSTAWVLLGGGSALIIVGYLIGNNKDASFGDAGTGIIMGGLGVFSAVGSIPLFIASSRNKRKALNASAYFKFEKIPSMQEAVIMLHSYPTLSLKINF